MHLYWLNYKMPYTVLRYPNVYGPRQNASGEAAVIATFATELLQNRPITIEGTGKATRDFVYVGDVVAANLAAAQKNATGIFNIGTGKQTSVLEVFKTLKRLTGASVPEHHGAARVADVDYSALNSHKAKKELGWKPKVSFKEGLKRTVEWYKESSRYTN